MELMKCNCFWPELGAGLVLYEEWMEQKFPVQRLLTVHTKWSSLRICYDKACEVTLRFCTINTYIIWGTLTLFSQQVNTPEGLVWRMNYVPKICMEWKQEIFVNVRLIVRLSELCQRYVYKLFFTFVRSVY